MYQLKKRIGNIISTLLKFALFICFAFPFYWMVTTAFKSYQESIAFPPTLWPHNFSWQAFISVCQKIDIIHYFKNSILVSTAVVILQAFINIPAAYGFARYDFKGKKAMWALVYDSTSNNVYPCLHYVFQGSTTEYPLAANITFCCQRLWNLSHAAGIHASS